MPLLQAHCIADFLAERELVVVEVDGLYHREDAPPIAGAMSDCAAPALRGRSAPSPDDGAPSERRARCAFRRRTRDWHIWPNHRDTGNVQSIIERKLAMLDAAFKLDDLRSPPGNRLEALKGDRRGQHAIRVNDQFRICFRWTTAGPEGVEVVDYH